MTIWIIISVIMTIATATFAGLYFDLKKKSREALEQEESIQEVLDDFMKEFPKNLDDL